MSRSIVYCAAIAGLATALVTTSAQSGESEVDLAALCGGEVCVCEPVPPTEGAAITIPVTSVEDAENICPPGYILVVNAAPATIQVPDRPTGSPG
jgi:hypothetical protein